MTKQKEQVPIWVKLNLTIEEASEYSNIGTNKIRELAREPTCEFVLKIGSKTLVKRKEFEEYIENRIHI